MAATQAVWCWFDTVLVRNGDQRLGNQVAFLNDQDNRGDFYRMPKPKWPPPEDRAPGRTHSPG